MHRLARFLDPRNTIEGKIISVILSVVLVFSMVNLSAVVENASAAGSDGDALFTTELATDDKAKTQTEGGEPTQNQVITDEQIETNTPDSNQPDQKNNGVATLSLDDDQNSDESNNAQSAPQQQQRAAAAPTPTAQASSLNNLKGKKLTVYNLKTINSEASINGASVAYEFDFELLSSESVVNIDTVANNLSGYNFDNAKYENNNVKKLKLTRSGYLGSYTYKLYYSTKENPTKKKDWKDIYDLDNLIFYYQVAIVPQSLTINPVQAEIEVGKTQQITATITPLNTNKDNTITWESSDPSIATVNESGIVTGKKVVQ